VAGSNLTLEELTHRYKQIVDSMHDSYDNMKKITQMLQNMQNQIATIKQRLSRYSEQRDVSYPPPSMASQHFEMFPSSLDDGLSVRHHYGSQRSTSPTRRRQRSTSPTRRYPYDSQRSTLSTKRPAPASGSTLSTKRPAPASGSGPPAKRHQLNVIKMFIKITRGENPYERRKQVFDITSRLSIDVCHSKIVNDNTGIMMKFIRESVTEHKMKKFKDAIKELGIKFEEQSLRK